jgi:hypothetical protein
MKKLLIFTIFFIKSCTVFSQDCSVQHYNLAKLSYIEVIGIDKYNLKNKGDKIFILEFECDTLGRLLSITKYKIFDKSLRKKQFRKFCKKFKKHTFKICNPEPELNKIEYFKRWNYRPKYNLIMKIS